LLLLGDGTGKFDSINAKESGFFTPGDVKSLELALTGNKAIIIVGNNNDHLQMFHFNK
jgi:hypothetical protein